MVQTREKTFPIDGKNSSLIGEVSFQFVVCTLKHRCIPLEGRLDSMEGSAAILQTLSRLGLKNLQSKIYKVNFQCQVDLEIVENNQKNQNDQQQQARIDQQQQRIIVPFQDPLGLLGPF